MNKFLLAALKEAKKAYLKGEVPIGAVIVLNGKIIARGHNLREAKQNVLGHAEIIVITKATKKLKSWRLDDCEMYVTLEPCPMCAGAIIQSRIKNVYFGALDHRNGSVISNVKLFDAPYTHKVNYEYLPTTECSLILSDFFKELRSRKNNK